MKSKICLCNGAVLKKDLTRFLPLMLIAVLLLGLIGWSYVEINGGWKWDIEHMEPVDTFLGFAMVLAFVSAVNLFGYLMKKGECDAMHALPVRRETLFFTHSLAALIQFVIPFGILFAFLPGNRGWAFQMFFTFCAWLFFFGLTVFAMMLSGRKLAAAIVFYMLLNIPTGIYGLIDSLYIPQLPGLYLPEELATELNILNYIVMLDYAHSPVAELLVPTGQCLLAGVALLAGALASYRRRKLERAGDFLAEKWLEPVFAWVMGIWAACILVTVFTLLGFSLWIGLILGLAVGYFAARMFFARSAKVFGKKSLLGFAVLAAVMAGSVLLVSMDPLGLVTKVPEMAQIESLQLQDADDYIYNLYAIDGTDCTLTDPEDIETVRSIHQEIVQQEEIARWELVDELYFTIDSQFYLTYRLTDGSELRRTYLIEDEEHLSRIEYLLSQPEYLVGTDDIEVLLSNVSELEAYGTGSGMIHTRRNFFQVFLKDCKAGNMYRTDYEEESAWSVSMYIATGPNGERRRVSIDIPNDAVDTIAWLEDYFH